MTFSSQLRIPGPTPLPERVVRAMSRPMVDHRGPEFAAILAEITAGAKRVFKTSSDLLFLTSSGTGGLYPPLVPIVPGHCWIAPKFTPPAEIRTRRRQTCAGSRDAVEHFR